MIRYALSACVLALAVPAAAQDTPEPPASPPASSQTTPSQPPSEPAQTTPAPTSTDVARIVQTEFPARDRDGNGALNQAEFSSWIGELLARAPSQGTPPSAADVQARAAAAFAQADTDRNRAISPAEMTALLSRTS